MAIIGIALLIGGAWLVTLHGSPYYLCAGIGLIVSGILLVRRKAEGALLYLLVFLATLAWAYWEVGTNGWALVPRLVGPAILLLLTLIVSPTLRSYRRKVMTAFAASFRDVFLVGIPFAVAAFLVSLFLRESRLKGSDGAHATEVALEDSGHF